MALQIEPGKSENGKKEELKEEKSKDKDVDINEKEAIKILFLDIDGVMNGSILDILKSPSEQHRIFSLDRVKRLKIILESTDCKIVLSTAWRRSNDGKERIKKQLISDGIKWNDIYLGDTPIFGFNDNYGNDPGSNDYPRPFEIKAFLDKLKSDNKYIIKSWCAVDDMDLMFGHKSKIIMQGHFVKTDGCQGLTDDDALKIIKVLNT